ncbi:MAG: hypothetical protein E7166_02790 [Firmicutes bacterium]|nr:hypothetical protein [Bacillota bacterium]
MKIQDNMKEELNTAVVNRCFIKKDNEYFIIEEMNNSKEVRKFTKKIDRNLHKLYLSSNYIYRDARTDEIVDITNFENCLFINTRNICDIEFLQSEFFKKNHAEILMTIMIINKARKIIDVNDVSNYKLLRSKDFLTSDFVKDNIKDIFDTLNNILIEKETSAEIKTKRKLLNRN